MKIKSKPFWLNKKIDFKKLHAVDSAMSGLSLHTVCHQAKCPNISECFERGTAAFMILGDTCTRECAFCNVKKGRTAEADPGEPDRVLEAVKKLNLNYVVITSVTRDDLPDGGASYFAAVVRGIRAYNKDIKIEVLTPDFKGDTKSLNEVLKELPDIFSHNLETVPSLYKVRKGADYVRSLKVLEHAKKFGLKVKSGIVLGLGEKEYEILSVFRDLRMTGCDYLSIGQYLQPENSNCEVEEYIEPDKFEYYKRTAESMGFRHVESGPYVRSSYFAEKYLENSLKFEIE